LVDSFGEGVEERCGILLALAQDCKAFIDAPKMREGLATFSGGTTK